MKIEYKELVKGAWHAQCNGLVIGGITILTSETSESGFMVIARDYTGIAPIQIPGSPFETVNQAKAALEYHFRNLTETQNGQAS